MPTAKPCSEACTASRVLLLPVLPMTLIWRPNWLTAAGAGGQVDNRQQQSLVLAGGGWQAGRQARGVAAIASAPATASQLAALQSNPPLPPPSRAPTHPPTHQCVR